ncbi:MAG: aminotransferase class I/II-fold pyridoxal phosphate-dependent enzyme [Polyangiaceae bacterium]|nr:aminotransferase class I/II-fold pyridoxal phosphate-dependent enzyme [Polyangiaceae bacterium]
MTEPVSQSGVVDSVINNAGNNIPIDDAVSGQCDTEIVSQYNSQTSAQIRPDAFQPMLLEAIEPRPKRITFSRLGEGDGGGPPEPSSMGTSAFVFDSFYIPHDAHVEAIANLQQFIAELSGALQAYVLVNGTTSGNLGMVLASVRPGQKIIIPRNAHKSVLGGVVLSGAAPVFIQPEISAELNLVFTIRPEQIQKAMKENPDATAVLLTNPTYQGFCLDLAKTERIVHEADKLLLIDEAHGPHFRFHPDLPLSSMVAGTDMAVQSSHKLIGPLAQSSVLLVGTNRVDQTMLRMAMSMITPSKASHLFVGSIEAAFGQMAQNGRAILQRVIDMTENARARINKVPGVRAIGREVIDKSESVVDLDVTKLVIDVSGLNLSGYRAARVLHDDYGVSAEMAGATTVTMVVTLGNDPKDLDRCVTGVEQLSRRQRSARAHSSPLLHILALKTPPMGRQVLVPRDAFFARKARVPIPESTGKISGESVVPYPPGIPVLVPGEEITPEIVEYLTSVRRTGVEIHGCEDRSISTLKVVDEREFLHDFGSGWG